MQLRELLPQQEVHWPILLLEAQEVVQRLLLGLTPEAVEPRLLAQRVQLRPERVQLRPEQVQPPQAQPPQAQLPKAQPAPETSLQHPGTSALAQKPSEAAAEPLPGS